MPLYLSLSNHKIDHWKLYSGRKIKNNLKIFNEFKVVIKVLFFVDNPVVLYVIGSYCAKSTNPEKFGAALVVGSECVPNRIYSIL